MGIYLVMTLLSCLIYFILDRFSKKKSFLKIFIALLPMCITSAIRYDVGWDYLKIYTNGFFLIGKGYMPHYFSEIPFDFLVKKIYIVSNQNPDWLFIICSVLTFIFLTKAIKDQSINVVFSILLVFLIRYYFLTLNIVRQGIAMSIILCSYRFIKERNFKKYVITILLASCFHLMSLIYIPIYYIYMIDWKKKKNILLTIILPIFAIIIYFAVLKYTKYGGYINSIYNDNNFLIHEIILSGTILFLAIMEKKNVVIEKEYFDTYFPMQILIFIVSVCSKFLPVADRIVWLLYIQYIFFIPIIIKNIKKSSQRILVTICLIMLMFTSVYMQTEISDSYNIIPYKTIFQK